MVELQNKIISALGLIARATKHNPQRAMRAIKIYESLMAEKQKRLLEMVDNAKR